MITILTGQKPELDDLEHFGVKGQKWGVRRQQRLLAKADKLTIRRDKLDNKINNLDRKAEEATTFKGKLKVAGTVAGAAAIVAGGIYAATLLKGHGAKKPSGFHMNIKKLDKAHMQLDKNFLSVDLPGGRIRGDREAVISGAKFAHEHLQSLGLVM